MPENIDREEIKVQKAVDLLNKNPLIKESVMARKTHYSYNCLLNRLCGLLPSSSCSSYNKKLALVEDITNSLKPSDHDPYPLFKDKYKLKRM